MHITENLTVQNIERIRTNFLSLYNAGTPIAITSEVLEDIDLGGIQFLLAVKRLSENTGATIHITIQLNAGKKHLIEAAGFTGLNTVIQYFA